MVEDGGTDVVADTMPAEWLSRAQALVPVALEKAKQVKGFPGRWKMIISKLELIPSRLSDLSSHPCFSKNSLCKEQLQAVTNTLNETIEVAELCMKGKYEGKLRTQSDLDSLSGKLDLNLRDCGLLIKTGVLGEVTLPSSAATTSLEPDAALHGNIKELLARLQIGHLEAKHKALDCLVEVIKEDEKNVLAALGCSSVAALVQLLTATSPRIRETTVTVICSLVESGRCENWLVSEGVLPPLIRLAESATAVGKEKATISLQRLSMSEETARSIVGHGGVRPLIDICRTGDSVLQAAAACALKNICAVPEVCLTLVEEGIVKVMINLLDCGILLGSKEYAAECLQNLTSSGDNLRRAVVLEGGIRSLLAYLDGPLPQESAVGALRNLVGSVPMEDLISSGLLPRLVHVLKSGSIGARQAAASAICQICGSTEMKKLVSEAGCIPLLVKMLEAKANSARAVAAQAISSLMTLSQNCREVKRDDKSVPNLVQLLDASPQNTAKKYAVACLLLLSSSKKCKRLMISYGAIGYLKKLSEMDIPGAKKLLEHLERGLTKGEPLSHLARGPLTRREVSSSAQYIIQHFAAATACRKLEGMLKSIYATGKVVMAMVDELGSAGVVAVPSAGVSQKGCFVIWQMVPNKWLIELVVGGHKVVAGSDGNMAWRHTPWLGCHAAKGGVRPLRRTFQGLDPLAISAVFSSAEFVGEKRVSGTDCFVLKLSADHSELAERSDNTAEMIKHVMFGYFSQRSGLLVYLEDSYLTRIQSPGSYPTYWETTMATKIDDYRTVEGVMIAHSGQSSAIITRFGDNLRAGPVITRMEESWIIDDLAFNVPGLSVDCFIPPEEVHKEYSDENLDWRSPLQQ